MMIPVIIIITIMKSTVFILKVSFVTIYPNTRPSLNEVPVRHMATEAWTGNNKAHVGRMTSTEEIFGYTVDTDGGRWKVEGKNEMGVRMANLYKACTFVQWLSW